MTSAELARKSQEARKVTVSVVLRSGETLASVQTRLGVSIREICHSVIRQVGPPGRLRMFHEGVKLTESDTLFSLGIRRDCQIDAEICSAVATASDDTTARVWNADTGECDHVLAGHEKAVCSVAFAPNFRSVVTASEDCTAKLWGMDTGHCTMTLSGHSDTLFSAKFSLDCRFVVTASADGTARVWIAKSGVCKFVLEGHRCSVHSAVFEPDGKSIITCAEDGTMKMWSAKSGVCDRTLGSQGTERTHRGYFNADGTAFVTPSGDGVATICNADGELLRKLEGHTGLVMSACFAVPEEGALP